MTPALADMLQTTVQNRSQAAGRKYPEQTMDTLQDFFQPYDDALLELLRQLPFNVNVSEVAAELQG